MRLPKYPPITGRVVRVVLLVLALLLVAMPGLANSESWSFTLDHRYLRGIDHSMTAGTMWNSGEIWAYEKLGGAVGPYDVHIDIRKNVRFLPDPLICSRIVRPDSRLNVKTPFSVYCGSVGAGKYYLEIWKVNEDGYHIKGAGTLKTN